MVRFLELNKSRAELSFRIEICKDEEETNNLKNNLNSVNRQIDELSNNMERSGINIATPNECEIARLNESLSGNNAKEILHAMKSRSGEVYDILAKRGKLIKQNYENRENIAKLALLLAKLPKEVKAALTEAIRRGELDNAIPLLNTDPAVANKIAAVLSRVGINATVEEGSLVTTHEKQEVEVKLPNKRVWVSSKIQEELNVNLEKMRQISSKIQLKNAVRQIKEFSEDEEKEFASMQDAYLKLLKEQDNLLKDFLDEEKISVTVS